MVVVLGNTCQDPVTGLWDYFIVAERQIVWTISEYKYEQDAYDAMCAEVARRNREHV